jgi:hypothetical protein
MNAYAMKTTEREIEDAYIELHRLLQGGQSHNAVKHAVRLARLDAAKLWNYLKVYISTDLNYRDTSQLLEVNAL